MRLLFEGRNRPPLQLTPNVQCQSSYNAPRGVTEKSYEKLLSFDRFQLTLRLG